MTRRSPKTDLRGRDIAARDRAQCEFESPLVVEAGAGTGKTAILVARIAAWSLGPGWERAAARLDEAARGTPVRPDDIAADCLRRVVAITFTDAAAAEMAGRTGKALVEIANGDLPVGFVAAHLPAAAELRIERSRALIGALDHLVVRTIHAFCRGLLAQYPLEAGLHPGFQVDADEGVQAEVVREVVEAAVARAYANPGDPDWIALAVAGVGPAEVEGALAILLGAGVSADEFAAAPFPPERIATFAADIDRAAAAFLQAGGRRLETLGPKSVAVQTLDAIATMRAAIARGVEPTIAGLQAFVTQAQEYWHENLVKRLSAWGGNDFGKAEAGAVGDDVEACAARAGALHEIVKQLLALDPERVERGRCVLKPLLAEARERMRLRGAATYDSLLRDARDLLTSNAGVSRRIRNDIDQLLVDEFQDTEPLQCELIHKIALEGEPEERPGLFLVGDPKQSIYGWRNADLGAYHDFVQEVLGDAEPDRLSLNFRSLPEILEEVECVIEPVMSHEDRMQPAFQPLIPHREAGPGTEPAVEYWVPWQWDADGGAIAIPKTAAAARIEAGAIAQDLLERRARDSLAWSDVGLLFRATTDLDTYLQALRGAGIPYAVERDRGYYRRREIIDASALVRCVLDPTDHIALLAWLRTPAVGVPDAGWLPLWQRDLPDRVSRLDGATAQQIAAIDSLIDEAVAEIDDDVPGVAAIAGWEVGLKHAIRAIAALRTSFVEDVAAVFVEKLRLLTLIEATEAARHLGAFRVANLDRFFRELQQELETAGDAAALLRRLRSDVSERKDAEEARPGTADDAVRVMTIHKAKGLDFAHTYVAQLHKQSGRGGRNRVAAEFARVAGGSEYRLWGAPTLGFAAVEAERARVGQAEQVRSLYVAMTRAKNRLVLLGNWSEAPAPVPAAEAKSQLALLASRESGHPDLASEFTSAARAASGGDLDCGGIRWRFPALWSAPPVSARDSAESAPAPSASALRKAAAALSARRDEAAARSARSWNAAPSAVAHADERVDEHADAREQQAARRFGDPATGTAAVVLPDSRSIARSAGTLVHRVLEAFELAADPATELARQRQRLPPLARSLAGGGDAEAVVRRAESILEKLGRGSLLERLCGLREGVVARELPVMLPPSDDSGAVGFVAGSIDLCYRDPATGEWVVADYKTDPIRSDDELAEHVARYAAQGRAYQRALRDALGLDADPRFELWFLDADRVEVVA